MDKEKKQTAMIVGGALVGITAVAVIAYRDEIAEKINALFSKNPTKYCEKEGKDIPESEWTSARCDVAPQTQTVTIKADLSKFVNISNVTRVEVLAFDSGGKIMLRTDMNHIPQTSSFEYVTDTTKLPPDNYAFTVLVYVTMGASQSITAFDFIRKIVGGDVITLDVTEDDVAVVNVDVAVQNTPVVAYVYLFRINGDTIASGKTDTSGHASFKIPRIKGMTTLLPGDIKIVVVGNNTTPQQLSQVHKADVNTVIDASFMFDA